MTLREKPPAEEEDVSEPPRSILSRVPLAALVLLAGAAFLLTVYLVVR